MELKEVKTMTFTMSEDEAIAIANDLMQLENVSGPSEVFLDYIDAEDINVEKVMKEEDNSEENTEENNNY